MRVLLRDEVKKVYWKANGDWVTDPADASAFENLNAAGNRARQANFADLSVVLAYEDPPCELAVNPAYCVEPQ